MHQHLPQALSISLMVDGVINFKTASWGVFAGAGLNVSVLFVEVSHEWSLTNIQKDVSQIDIGKTRSLFAQVGVRIVL